ncbi:hypothetical protein DPMN_026479 [Dreissena polymorpha]|uniref:Uncharacterized protein n=2 Tax=Dreissena polymorpha TaxID=45954 RepID=A0A9D4REL6_DREPO|nr:hypothetical protein DPMN_026479 [Dreissena polymorpha]
MSLEVSGSKRSNEVENEAQEIEALVYSAKVGQWQKVWDILGSPSNPRKGYLINVIPQSRRWGVLHQAVYWQDPNILRIVLKFKSCDSDMKAKKCMSACGETGRMNSLDIANAYGYTAMSTILSNHMMNSVREQKIPTFQPYDGYCDNKGLCLLSVTLASYKPAFHPSPVDPNKSVLTLLLDIFTDICRGDSRWKKVQEVVADSVYAVSSEKAEYIRACIDRESFFGQVIRSYTNENNSIYSYLNMAFRRQREQNYSPSADDLAMGPYCVMYQMLLLFWNNLERENTRTYRKMVLTKTDADKYTKGTKFVWQSIVSSAVQHDHTHAFPTQGPIGDTTIIFTIDNSTPCVWQPRNIEAHAEFEETERTYPAGAKFVVTNKKVVDGEVRVDLTLLAK